MQYYHEGLGDKAITYLSDATIKHPPSVAWMPLGLARLRALPTAFSLGLPDRSHLWSWMGSMEGKPERAEMLQAVEAHSRAADIQAMGFLRIFKWFAGGFSDGAASTGGPDAMDAMQYTMLMHQTQFVPVPAGNSPEQFRLWEALEAGGAVANTCHARHGCGHSCSSSAAAAIDRIYSAMGCLWEPAALGLSLLALGRLPAHPAGAALGAGWGALPIEGAGL